MTQFALRFDGMGVVDGATDTLVDLLAEAVRLIGPKQCAGAFEVPEGNLSNALKGRDRHPRKLDWLPYVIINSPTLAIPEFLASLRGQVVIPERPVSPEEELVALREALGELLGPELRVALMAAVRRKMQEARR
jgi:hypothetical protein